VKVSDGNLIVTGGNRRYINGIQQLPRVYGRYLTVIKGIWPVFTVIQGIRAVTNGKGIRAVTNGNERYKGGNQR